MSDEPKYPPKSEWGPGPWQEEPDGAAWKTAAGYWGRLIRNPFTGTFCGYVLVPRSNKAHGEDYYGAQLHDIRVHHGLTWAGGAPNAETAADLPEDHWWLGFDTAHAWDLAPGLEATMERIYARTGEVRPTLPVNLPEEFRPAYRCFSYCYAEVEMLAQQLRHMERDIGKPDT